MTAAMPSLLFHGTTSTRARVIDREGLRPGCKPRWPRDGNRRYVYLCEHPRAALGWASNGRKNTRPVVYFVDAEALRPDRLEPDPADPHRQYGPLWRYRGRISVDALVRCRVQVKRDTTTVAAERRPEFVALRLAQWKEAQ